MTEETAAPSGEITVLEAPADTGADLSISQAARALASARHRKPEAAESAEVATAEPELAQANAAAVEEQPTGETQEVDPAQKPPLDLPRSWTKDRTEHWAKLDPGTQEFLLEQDRKASAEVRRVQNEAAEKLKGLTAKEQEVEKVRQQYEAQLPALMQSLQDAQQASFADIKTVADVEKLQNEDPFRFQSWQVQQMKLQAAHAETERVNREKSQAQQTEWTDHVRKENELAAEHIPDLADKDKGSAFYKRAIERLNELGFKPDEVNDLATGKQKLSIHDHRLQQLLWSDFRLADIQKAKIAVTAKPLPTVQQPGVSKPSGSVASEQTQALTRKLETSGSLKDAVALRALQSQRRAS